MKPDTLFHNGVEVSIEGTSEAVCKTWLDARPEHQRIVKKASVNAIASDLTEGRWTFNGATICFDSDGGLIDGQHRLLAMLASGKFQPVIVVRGVAPEAYSDIDSGISRTYSDAFKHAGILNYVAASSASVMWAQYGAGKLRANRVSKKELLAVYEKHRESITWAFNKWKTLDGILSKSRRIFLISFAFERLGQAEAESFFNGIESSVGSPAAIAFRKFLVRESNKTRGKLSQVEVVAIGIKALRFHAEGKPVSVLKWISEETFPILPARKEEA